MTSLSISKDTKADINEIKEDDETYDECVQRILEVYKQNDADLAIDELVEQTCERISDRVATDVELAAHRGTADALEEVFDV